MEPALLIEQNLNPKCGLMKKTVGQAQNTVLFVIKLNDPHFH